MLADRRTFFWKKQFINFKPDHYYILAGLLHVQSHEQFNASKICSCIESKSELIKAIIITGNKLLMLNNLPNDIRCIQSSTNIIQIHSVNLSRLLSDIDFSQKYSITQLENTTEGNCMNADFSVILGYYISSFNEEKFSFQKYIEGLNLISKINKFIFRGDSMQVQIDSNKIDIQITNNELLFELEKHKQALLFELLH